MPRFSLGTTNMSSWHAASEVDGNAIVAATDDAGAACPPSAVSTVISGERATETSRIESFSEPFTLDGSREGCNNAWPCIVDEFVLILSSRMSHINRELRFTVDDVCCS